MSALRTFMFATMRLHYARPLGSTQSPGPHCPSEDWLTALQSNEAAKHAVELTVSSARLLSVAIPCGITPGRCTALTQAGQLGRLPQAEASNAAVAGRLCNLAVPNSVWILPAGK